MIESISELGRKYIGVSVYRLRAEPHDAPSVLSCSTLLWWLYRQHGPDIPRFAFEQYLFCNTYHHIDDVRPGDWGFTQTPYLNPKFLEENVLKLGHVGLVTDRMTVLHASFQSRSVSEVPLEDFYYYKDRGLFFGRVDGLHD